MNKHSLNKSIKNNALQLETFFFNDIDMLETKLYWADDTVA